MNRQCSSGKSPFWCGNSETAISSGFLRVAAEPRAQLAHGQMTDGVHPPAVASSVLASSGSERAPKGARMLNRRKRQWATKTERELEAKLALGFWQETVRRPCRVCGSAHDLEAHHVIAKSVLKRELASKGKPCPVGFLWDPRNGMSLCHDCHERFTNRALQICITKIPAGAFEFARDHGLMWRLVRDYPNLSGSILSGPWAADAA